MLEAKFANPVIATHLRDAEPYHQGDYTTTLLIPHDRGKVAVTFLSGRSRDSRTGFNLLTLAGIEEWSDQIDRLEYDNNIRGIVIADSSDPQGKGINPGIDVKEFVPTLKGLRDDLDEPADFLLDTGCDFYAQIYGCIKPVAGLLAGRNMGGIIELIVNPVGFLALGNNSSIMSPECKLDLLYYLKKAGCDPAKDFGIDEENVPDRLNVFEGWLQAQTGLQAMFNRGKKTHQECIEFIDKCAFDGYEVSALEALEYGRADMVGKPEELLPAAIQWIKSVADNYQPKKLIGDNGWGPIQQPQSPMKRTNIGQVAGAHVLYGKTYSNLQEMIEMNNAALIQSIVEGYGITEKCPTVYNTVRRVTGVESFLALREAA